MKSLLFNSKKSMTTVSAFAILLSAIMFSCIPDPNGPGTNNGTDPETKPEPQGTLTAELYKDSGDNIAGLGLSSDGFLTTILSTSLYGEWYLASVGIVPSLGNVDYIPMNGWGTMLFPRVGMGFIGYCPTQGFVRFVVGAIAQDNQGELVGVGLKYLGKFTGSDDPIELEESVYDFDEDGGTMIAKLKGLKYSTYQLVNDNDWIRPLMTSSAYSFIYDRIEINVEPNESPESRSGLIKLVTASGKETTFIVTQAGTFEES